MRNRLSIKEVVELLDFQNENLLYSQFLDDFYHAETKIDKYNLIKDEPEYKTEHKNFLCILAGTTHKLSVDYGLIMPQWILERKYYLDSIYYAFDTKNEEFQAYLMQTTPHEFKERNLMVGDSLLERY